MTNHICHVLVAFEIGRRRLLQIANRPQTLNIINIYVCLLCCLGFGRWRLFPIEDFVNHMQYHESHKKFCRTSKFIKHLEYFTKIEQVKNL